MITLAQKLINLYRNQGARAVQLALARYGLLPLAAILDKTRMDQSWRLPGAPNRLNVQVFALRRSGHHAILNWIRYHLPVPYCFLNDCRIGENPFQTCSRDNSIVKGPFGEHRYINWNQEQAAKHAKKGILIHNYEDTDFTNLELSHKQEKSWLGESDCFLKILILRDPFNLFASKLHWAYSRKMLAPTIDELKKLPALWKKYAVEFINDSDFLANKIGINYNKWFTSSNYRDSVATQIGFHNRDIGVNEVAKWGPTTWGDSFDGLKYDGDARKMKVLERWKQYVNDPFFIHLFQDKELWELSERIFGEINGSKALLQENQ